MNVRDFMEASEAQGQPLPLGIGPVFELSQIWSAVPRLIESLRQHNGVALLAQIGGLLTEPSLHPNTLRLEVLAHLVFVHARGHKKAKRKALVRFLNRELQLPFVTAMEDSIEDVFVSNVVSSSGNHRIFEGIWEAADHWLQEVLYIIVDPQVPPWMAQVRQSVISLLKLSEEVARRAQVARFTMGEGQPQGVVPVPYEATLRARSEAVQFQSSDLQRLGIQASDLSPFISSLEQASEAANDVIGNSHLERRPLVQRGNWLILALPTAVSVAVRRYVTETMQQYGALQAFARELRQNQMEACLHDGLNKLRGFSVPQGWLPQKPAVLSFIDHVLCRFDTDKYAHVVLLHDNLEELAQVGLTTPTIFSDLEAEAFERYVQDCARAVLDRPECRGGLTVIIFGGLGRGFRVPRPPSLNRWHCSAFSLPDWLALGWIDRWSLLSLWKLKEQIAYLECHQVQVHDTNGDFNTFAYWSDHNFHLIPADFPFGSTQERWELLLPTDCVSVLRQRFRQGYDKHAVALRNPASWVEVQRLKSESSFQEERDLPLYESPDALMNGWFYGVMETKERGWWVIAKPSSPEWQADLLYRLWNCLLSWLVNLAPVLESAFPRLPDGPIQIMLSLEDFEAYQTPEVFSYEGEALPPTFEVDVYTVSITLRIQPGFVKLFHQPLNMGEHELLIALVRASMLLSGRDDALDLAREMVGRAVPNDQARFMHVFLVWRPKDILADIRLPAPRFVPPEDLAFSCLGLARLPNVNTIEREVLGVEPCTNFLNKNLVEAFWQRIRTKLTEVDRSSIVVRAMGNLEALDRDRNQWQRTAQALLAVHQNQEDVVGVAMKREWDRNQAGIMYRALIEMAACTCPQSGGRVVSDADLDSLSADISALIDSANQSDAIRHELAEARIILSPDGNVRTDRDFSRKVVEPYGSGFFSAQFREAVALYERLFEEPAHNDGPSRPEQLIDAELVAAFREEYGFSFNEFADAIVTIEQFAVERKQVVVQCRESEIRAYLVERGVMAQDAAQRFMERFTLPQRERWDEQPPDGFLARDWYPWRFSRRLSLIARPFVPVDGLEDKTLAFGVALLDLMGRNLIDRLINGHFPQDFFSSDAMRSWIGGVSDRLGHDFSDTVAAWFREKGWQARSHVNMTEFGAPMQVPGDVDVLAWNPTDRRVFVIECKRLQFARTIGEIAEQLSKFKGEAGDELAKHLARSRWLLDHHDCVRRCIHLTHQEITIFPLMVTNTIVPMQFVAGLPLHNSQILPFSDLESIIRSRAGI